MSALLLGAAIVGSAFNLMGKVSNWDMQRRSNDLQRESLDESMRSNYYSYMQQLESMRNEYSQDSLAVDQALQNIATNRNYLDRWAEEYDLSMNNAVDEGFAQYQQMASNLGTGLAAAGESGARGGSVGLINAGTARSLSQFTGQQQGFGLGGSFGTMLRGTALDMLADRQTAISAVETDYRSIPMYRESMKLLQGSIDSMEKTTESMGEKLRKKGMEV